MSGRYSDAAKLVYDAFAIMQPAMDSALASFAVEMYAGSWISEDKRFSARVTVDKGTLFVEALMLEGIDALRTLGAKSGERLALRYAGHQDEFRCVFTPDHYCHLRILSGPWQHRHGTARNQREEVYGLYVTLGRH